MIRKILDNSKIKIILNRLSNQIVENHTEIKESILVAIQPRGTQLCDMLHNYMKQQNVKMEKAKIDISFFRDDFRRNDKIITPSKIDLNVSLENKNVILVDDVLYTGRTVRSALEAILNFGRPKKIELLVFVDRRFCRELPIQADYFGIEVDTLENERVIVNLNDEDSSIYLTNQNE